MKRHTPTIIALLTSLILLSSHLLAGNTRDHSEEMETLYGLRLHQGKLEISVKSNGCTEAGHFSVQTEAVDDQNLLTSLTVVRQKPDRCRKMPRVISIELDMPQTEKMRYQLVNPLQSS